MYRSATFSPCGRFRYVLARSWQHRVARAQTIAFVGLNPSTADARFDDPTIRRCMGFARNWGYQRLLVVNLFALCTPHPADLKAADEPIGPDNGAWLARALARSTTILVCWGRQGHCLHRDIDFLRTCRRRLHCLGINRDGTPVHPLYQPASRHYRPWPRSTGS